jgi:NADPH2:quinone reductase
MSISATGLYPIAMPFTPGTEAAGTVLAVGAEVSDFRKGDRVAYQGVPGTYAEQAVVAADRLVPIPEGVSTRTAGALILQGMTAHYLATSTYALKAGDTALVHAAAGGVGLLLCQIAKLRGAKVIGTVSTEAKGGARTRSRCRPCHPLYAAGFCGGNQAPDRQPRCPGRIRLRRPYDF